MDDQVGGHLGKELAYVIRSREVEFAAPGDGKLGGAKLVKFLAQNGTEKASTAGNEHPSRGPELVHAQMLVDREELGLVMARPHSDATIAA